MKSLQKKHGAASTREMEKIEKVSLDFPCTVIYQIELIGDEQRIKRRMKEMQIKESQLVTLLEEEKTVQGRSTSLLQEANILQNLVPGHGIELFRTVTNQLSQADRVMQYKSLGAHVAM